MVADGELGKGILDALLQHVRQAAEQRTVADLCLGLGYSSVVLDDGNAGVAYTLHGARPGCCSVLDDAGSIRGRNAWELLAGAFSGHPLRATLGVATINALAPAHSEAELEGDLLEHLPVSREDQIGMVGYFAPFMRLKERVGGFYVLEEQEFAEPDVYPAEKAAKILPQCSVVVITSVTIVNGTFDALVGLAAGAREVVLVGPSTPLFPQVFRHYGVTLLAGCRVKDARRLLQIVGESGGTRHFGPAVRKLAMRVA